MKENNKKNKKNKKWLIKLLGVLAIAAVSASSVALIAGCRKYDFSDYLPFDNDSAVSSDINEANAAPVSSNTYDNLDVDSDAADTTAAFVPSSTVQKPSTTRLATTTTKNPIIATTAKTTTTTKKTTTTLKTTITTKKTTTTTKATTTTKKTTTTTTVAKTPTKAEVDAWANECLAYAKSYAKSVGLEIVSDCVCYDDPLGLGNGVTLDKELVKSNIRGRINRVLREGNEYVTFKLAINDDSMYYAYKLYVKYG